MLPKRWVEPYTQSIGEQQRYGGHVRLELLKQAQACMNLITSQSACDVDDVVLWQLLFWHYSFISSGILEPVLAMLPEGLDKHATVKFLTIACEVSREPKSKSSEDWASLNHQLLLIDSGEDPVLAFWITLNLCVTAKKSGEKSSVIDQHFWDAMEMIDVQKGSTRLLWRGFLHISRAKQLQLTNARDAKKSFNSAGSLLNQWLDTLVTREGGFLAKTDFRVIEAASCVWSVWESAVEAFGLDFARTMSIAKVVNQVIQDFQVRV